MSLYCCRNDRQCNSKRKGKLPPDLEMEFAGCTHEKVIRSRKKRSKSCYNVTSISPEDMETPSGMGRRSISTASFLTTGESTSSFTFFSGRSRTPSTDFEDSSRFGPLSVPVERCLSDSHFASQSFRSRASPNYESDDSSRPGSALGDLRPSSREERATSGSSYCYTPSKYDDFRQSPRQGVLSPIYAEYVSQHSCIEVSTHPISLAVLRLMTGCITGGIIRRFIAFRIRRCVSSCCSHRHLLPHVCGQQ